MTGTGHSCLQFLYHARRCGWLSSPRHALLLRHETAVAAMVAAMAEVVRVVATAEAAREVATAAAAEVATARSAALHAERANILARISDQHSKVFRNWTANDGRALKPAGEETYELLLTDPARLVDEGVMEPECVLSCQTSARLVLDYRSLLDTVDAELKQL